MAKILLKLFKCCGIIQKIAATSTKAVQEYADKESMCMNPEYVGAVVISGLVIVFLGLILLIIAVNVMGAVFKGIKSMRKKQKPADPVQDSPRVIPLPSEPLVIPQSEDDEIIAVIAAAIAAIGESTGKRLSIKSIRQKNTRSSWAGAALHENTRPF